MKNSIFFAAVCILLAVSCEKNSDYVFIRLGSGQEFRFSDIELYDTSTNILYFRKSQEYLEDMYENTFSFFSDGGLIYRGIFLPGYSSSIPTGPFIWSPPMYGNYALKIENMLHPDGTDARKDPLFIRVLSQQNLLHSGLEISSGSVVISGTLLTFKFTVTNHDQDDLLILDPDKTGLNLFHYFTNGLHIYDPDHNEVFSGGIQHQSPNPRNSWRPEWLSELKSGDSREFTLNYTIENPLKPGEYIITFRYPGLGNQVRKEQLYQGSSRIWLGDISLNERNTIE